MVPIVSILAVVVISLVSVEGQPYGQSCGGGSDIIAYQGFKLLTSHPSQAGQTARIEITVNVKEDLVGTLQANVEVEYQVLLFWVKSCLESSDNCFHNNFCTLIPNHPCVFKAGVQTIPVDLALPSDAPSGNYRVRVELSTTSGQKGCVFVQGIKVA